MIVIEDILAHKDIPTIKKIADFLKSIKEDKENNIIIFWDSSNLSERMTKEKIELFKFLAGQKFSQEFKALSNAELTAWVKKEAQAAEINLNDQAIHLLISLTGNNLWQIHNELNKLASYKKAQSLIKDQIIYINADDVEELVKGQVEASIFSLTDAISSKNKALALKLLEEQVKAGMNESYLLTMIFRQFRILLQIRQLLDLGFSTKKIATTLKVHPFVAQKGVLQARYFNLESLKKIYRKLTEIDYQMKSGQRDILTNLNLLITSMS